MSVYAINTSIQQLNVCLTSYVVKFRLQSLRRDVEANQDELREREEDIDGTIAQWKTHLARNKEITSDQADTLVKTAMAFAENLSSDNAVIQTSKALQAEISFKESKLRESMDSSETFVLSEQPIREIVRQERHRTNDVQPAAGNRQRKVSFSDNPGRQSRSQRQQQKLHRNGSSKSPKGRSKSPRSNSSKRVHRPRSSAKKAQGKGSGPAK